MWMKDNVAAMFGYRAEDVEPTGTWWEERLHPDDRARVGSSLDDVIGSGGPLWGAGERLRRPAGGVAPLALRGGGLPAAARPPPPPLRSVVEVCEDQEAEAGPTTAV